MKLRRTTGRVTALLAAAATTIALAAPGAGAETQLSDLVYAGQADALALDLRLTAPTALLGAVTGTGNTLQQTVSLTDSLLNSDGAAVAVTKLLDGLLNQGQLSSRDGQTSERQAILEQDIAGLVQVGAGVTEFTADAANGLTNSFSELARLRVSLAPLLSSGQVSAEVTETLQDTVGQVTATVDGLVGTLNSVLADLEDTLQDTTGELVEIPEVVPAELLQVPDLTSVDIVDVRKIWSDSTVKTEGGLIKATAESGIVSASLLGGLIEVPAFQYSSAAQTAGLPGTADASTKVTTIAVSVAGSDVVRIEDNKLTVGDFLLDLNDPALSGLEVDLQAVNDVLNQLLNVVGLSISQGEGRTQIAPDGSSASATTSAFAIRLTPLHAVGADDLLSLNLELLPTKAAVSAAPRQVTPAAGPPAAPPPAVPVALPRTGGGAAVMLLGLVAMGGATLLRRLT